VPIYEYECTCCPSKFELKRGFHDEDPVSCPHCGGKTRRRFSSVPIIFKGSGFYVTDSRGGSSFTSSATPSDEKTESAKPSAEPKVEKSATVESKTSATT
jgi:putative FmdB family regulatory protein